MHRDRITLSVVNDVSWFMRGPTGSFPDLSFSEESLCFPPHGERGHFLLKEFQTIQFENRWFEVIPQLRLRGGIPALSVYCCEHHLKFEDHRGNWNRSLRSPSCSQPIYGRATERKGTLIDTSGREDPEAASDPTYVMIRCLSVPYVKHREYLVWHSQKNKDGRRRLSPWFEALDHPGLCVNCAMTWSAALLIGLQSGTSLLRLLPYGIFSSPSVSVKIMFPDTV